MGRLLKYWSLLLGVQSTWATDHLAFYWPLDQNANDVATAGSVTDNGSFVGSESYAPGLLGDSVSLDGTNYITIPNSPDNDGKSETLTVSAWCRTSGFLEGVIIAAARENGPC
ncbi:MAG: hypothetical protein ACON38_09615 [Akkermansiaceae bacterium]